jgi:hypothetical protein
MQGLPLKDQEGYLPFLPNSSEGPPEAHNKLGYEVGITNSFKQFQIVSNSLEAFQLPINPTLSSRQDLCLLPVNSSGQVVVIDDTEIPTRPNIGSGVEDPLFQSESFRTPAHTIGTYGFGSIPLIVHDLYGNLGTSLDQPMASQVPETFVSYTVPLDHFTGMTSNVIIIADQLLIGSHLNPTI